MQTLIDSLRLADETVQALPDRWQPPLVPKSLPLDCTCPTGDIVDFLRQEKYVADPLHSTNAIRVVVRDLYYLLRPMLPVGIRRHLQRLALRNWQKQSFPRWPLDFTVESIHEGFLKAIIRESGDDSIPFIWFWPEGLPACAIMTHDVETRAGRDMCTRIMDFEDRVGVSSSFELIPENRYSTPETLLDEIRARGHEICIHGLNHDGHMFDSLDEFTRRVEKIRSYADRYQAIGFRSPAMYRNVAWLEQLPFLYDMSIPNVGRLEAQAGGCCTVLPFFVGELVELPLTMVQDYWLYHIIKKDAFDLWREQLAAIGRRNGLASFIIHPDYHLSSRTQDTFNRLLDHLAEHRAERSLWLARPDECYKWWLARSRMVLKRDNGEWRIVGDGCERARLGRISLDGEDLNFEID